MVDCVVEVRVTDENLPFAMVRAPLKISSAFWETPPYRATNGRLWA